MEGIERMEIDLKVRENPLENYFANLKTQQDKIKGRLFDAAYHMNCSNIPGNIDAVYLYKSKIVSDGEVCIDNGNGWEHKSDISNYHVEYKPTKHLTLTRVTKSMIGL